MSTHPNVILMAVFTPDDLSRKTYRAMCDELGDDVADMGFKIGQRNYNLTIMESDYDDSWQISAAEGSIVAHDYLTYGYGEVVTWEDLTAAKEALDEWARSICERHHCTHSIQITANYW